LYIVMRFAGSEVSFSPQPMASASTGTGAAAAANVVNAGDTFAAMRSKAPRFDQISAEAMRNQSAEKQAAMTAEANVVGAGIGAVGQTQGAALQARGQIEAAKAQAEAQKSSAMMGAIGSIASAGLGLLSDESTKTAVQPIESALSKLRQLKPVTFYYKPEYADHTRMHHGFIAQEYKQVMPDATYMDPLNEKLCIDTNDLIALLVRANQELESRVTRLEAKSVLETV
jgi:hypothetical protein